MSLSRLVNYVSRKLLYLWVRTEVIPANAEKLGLHEDIPVIYVLDARAWSSLLVLEQESERMGLVSPLQRLPVAELKQWHSVYTVAPRQPFKAWLENRPKRSRMLRGILEVLREYPELDVQFVPVTIFWGRPVSKQQHWLTVLFSQSWEIAGRTRRFFTILIHGRNTLVQFSAPIRYRDCISDDVSNDATIDRMQTLLSGRLTEIKTATLGPDTSHRRTLVRDLLLTPRVQDAIRKRSIEDNISQYTAALQARRYLYEIVADRTSITIRLMQIGLTWFWNRFYSGINVRHSDTLRELALTHELIYVPCHRSHVDYLLLSYVIHYEGLSIPHIAAGKNLNMPLIGPILRGGGAFFIRRTFRGNELYSSVLFAYLTRLLTDGAPVEYFIEGGRSRTGRLLSPKPGMLSMTVRAFLNGRSRPLAFVPVYIGYEKMIEGKSYVAELSGAGKKHETLLTSVRSILSIRGRFGKVTASFGEPVYLTQLLDRHKPQWPIDNYDDRQRPPWLMDVVEELGTTIMERINCATYANAVNIVATILLGTPKQHMDESELGITADLVASLIRGLEYSDRISVTSLDGRDQVLRALALRRVRRRRHELGDIIYINSTQAILLTYYRNNILHLLALPSIISCCFINSHARTTEEISHLVTLIYPVLKQALYIAPDAAEIEAMTRRILDLFCEHALLRKTGGDAYERPSASRVESARLDLLSKIISPTLELYYITFVLLQHAGSGAIDRNELTDRSHLLAQRVSLLYELSSPDFFDRRLISSFIDALLALEYVHIDADGNIAYSIETLEQGEDAMQLLNSNIRSGILQLLNSTTTQESPH